MSRLSSTSLNVLRLIFVITFVSEHFLANNVSRIFSSSSPVSGTNDSVLSMQNSVGSNIETLYHIFDNRAEALEFKVEKDSPVIGKPIMELKLKDNLLLACLNRNGKVIIPRGQDVICEGDYVVVVTTHTGFTDVSDILKWQ